MSVGNAVGAVVGAVIGFYVGGPAGALKGAQLGMTLGGIVDPPRGPSVNGPRLTDLTLQSSSYDSVIPRVYGAITLTGNIIWLENNQLKEVARTNKSGGKGGGGSSEVTTYSYYATFAVALCKGPIDGIKRIWVGPELIYDAGSSDLKAIIASNDATTLFNFHSGTDTQLADERMQATLGVSNTPAYRGLTYIVLKDYPLSKHGNSLSGAQVKVEVVKSGLTTNNEWHSTRIISPNVGPTYLNNSQAVYLDTDNDLAYYLVPTTYFAWASSPPYVCDIYKQSLSGGSPIKIRQISLPYGNTAYPNPLSLTGNYRGFCCAGDGGSLVFINLNGAIELSIPMTVFAQNGESWGTNDARTNIYVDTTRKLFAYGCTISVGQRIRVRQWNANALLIGASIGDSQVDAFGVHEGYLYSQEVVSGTPYIRKYSFPQMQLLNQFLSSTPIHAVVLIPFSEDCFFCIGTGSVGHRYDNNLVTSVISAYYNSQGLFGSYGGGGSKCIGETFYCVASAVNASYSMVVSVYKRYKTVSNPTLASVVSAECLSSKILTALDIDVTALTKIVKGYRIGRITSLKTTLEPLQAAYPFDIIQSGYKIKFKPRGSTSVATIPVSDLGSTQGE